MLAGQLCQTQGHSVRSPKLSFELPPRCSALKGWILFAKKPPGNDVTGRGHHLESAGSIQISVTELIGVDKSTKLLDNSWAESCGGCVSGHKLFVSRSGSRNFPRSKFFFPQIVLFRVARPWLKFFVHKLFYFVAAQKKFLRSKIFRGGRH